MYHFMIIIIKCQCGSLMDTPRQVTQAHCPQRPDSSFLCFSWSPSHKGTFRVVPDGREATRWSDTRPVAERKVDVLGSLCHLSSVICPCVSGAAIEAGAAAEVAASRKEAK